LEVDPQCACRGYAKVCSGGTWLWTKDSAVEMKSCGCQGERRAKAYFRGQLRALASSLKM